VPVCGIRARAVLFMLILRRLITWAAIVRTALCRLLPGLIRRPLKREHCDCPGGGEGAKTLQSLQENFSLQLGLMWLASRMSERIIKESRPWGVDRAGNVQGTTHAQGRQASGLRVPGNQSNGLMAHGSHRDQQDNIHLIGE
jgi:hypothetical protein